MPKLILEFDLDTEREQYEDAIGGCRWHAVVQEIDNELRAIIKHVPEFASEKDSIEMAEYIRDRLFEEINGLELYK